MTEWLRSIGRKGDVVKWPVHFSSRNFHNGIRAEPLYKITSEDFCTMPEQVLNDVIGLFIADCHLRDNPRRRAFILRALLDGQFSLHINTITSSVITRRRT